MMFKLWSVKASAKQLLHGGPQASLQDHDSQQATQANTAVRQWLLLHTLACLPPSVASEGWVVSCCGLQLCSACIHETAFLHAYINTQPYDSAPSHGL